MSPQPVNVTHRPLASPQTSAQAQLQQYTRPPEGSNGLGMTQPVPGGTAGGTTSRFEEQL